MEACVFSIVSLINCFQSSSLYTRVEAKNDYFKRIAWLQEFIEHFMRWYVFKDISKWILKTVVLDQVK